MKRSSEVLTVNGVYLYVEDSLLGHILFIPEIYLMCDVKTSHFIKFVVVI